MIFAGHSLGSGVATMLIVIVANHGNRLGVVPGNLLRCYAVAPIRCLLLNLVVMYADVIYFVVLQFPIECSLPWMLVDHVIESHDSGLLESVLMPLTSIMVLLNMHWSSLSKDSFMMKLKLSLYYFPIVLLVLLRSMDGADLEWAKEVKCNVYDMVVEGFQLLSRWTGCVWEKHAWKFSRPCKDPHLTIELRVGMSCQAVLELLKEFLEKWKVFRAFHVPVMIA